MNNLIYNTLMHILALERESKIVDPRWKYSYPERGYSFSIDTINDIYFYVPSKKCPIHFTSKRVLIIRFNEFSWGFRHKDKRSKPYRETLIKSKYYIGRKLNWNFYTERYGFSMKSIKYIGHFFDLDLIESDLNICMSEPLTSKPKYRVPFVLPTNIRIDTGSARKVDLVRYAQKLNLNSQKNEQKTTHPRNAY